MLERQEISNENDDSDNIKEENIMMNDSLSNKLNKRINSDTNKSDDLLGSEEIFINIKKEIETVKKRNEAFHVKKESTKSMNNNLHSNNDLNSNKFKLLTKTKDNIQEEESSNNEFYEFNLNDDYIGYEYSNFNNSGKKNDKFDLNKDWKKIDKDFPRLSENNNGYEYIELNQMAIRVIKEIDFDEMGVELNLNFNLIGTSQIFVFTRSFVNKDINESGIFEDDIYNIEKNDIFNKYTSLIKISKDMKKGSSFITFGTYYNDKYKNNKLCHKFFLQRQLIDYNEEKNYNEYDDRKEYQTEFNMVINDLGNENINARIYLNKNKKPNDISGNFFLPINKKAKIMIFGMGTGVRLRNVGCKIFNKRNESIKNLIKFESENSAPKNCQCCYII
jgi:hypothetical protein